MDESQPIDATDPANLGRLFDDASDGALDDEADLVAAAAEDTDLDPGEELAAEEAAMHLEPDPPFRADDSYLDAD